MRTLVVSDLHLGTRDGADVLRRPAARAALTAALEGVDRLVLLGDSLELRHGPARAIVEKAAPVMRELGAAMADGEVLIVPGNHDHGLLRRYVEDGPRLGLEQRLAPADASPAAEALAAALAPAHVELAYPGVWLRHDVYATHGHYLDVHTTVPTFERLGAGLMARLVGAPPGAAQASDYEAVLAPLYAWVDATAQRTNGRRKPAGENRAVGIRAALLAPGRRPLRARLLAAGFPLAVAAVNGARLGPVRADASGPALREGGLAGMREAAARLGIDAAHLVFGHTHRAGPLPGDDPLEWTAGATRLHNSGSWIHWSPFVGDRGAASPYWPGGAVEVGDDPGDPPRLRRLLAGVGADELRGPGRG